MFNSQLMSFINSLAPALVQYQTFGYVLILLISFFESVIVVGLVMPGTIFNIFMGFLAGEGYFDLGYLILFASLGAILGDTFSFYLGKRGTKAFKPENKIFKSKYLEMGERFFKKHGSKSVFLGRFIHLIRPIIAFVAGLFKMDEKKFFFWNILSGFAWAISYLVLGYFLGQAWEIVAAWSTRIGIFILAIIIVLIIFYLLKQLILKSGKQFFAFLKSILVSIGSAIVNNPDVKKLVANHPSFFGFLKRRLEIRNFYGLTLTLLILALIYALALFLDITKAVLTAEPIVGADIRIENLLSAFRQPLMVKIFTWITLLGEWWIVGFLALIISLLFWLWRKKIYLIPLWLTLAGSLLFSFLGKIAVHRPRPAGLSVFQESSFSFPSAHATIAVAFYGFIIYFLWHNLKNWRRKLNVLFVGLILVLAIGFSRLYLGEHFLSDVWGGYLLGLLWLLIGISLTQWLFAIRKTAPLKIVPNLKLKIISWFLILVWLAVYFSSVYFYKPPLSFETMPATQTVSGDVLNIFSTHNLNKYTETLIGDKQEPLSFIITAKDDKALINSFKKSSWQLSDPINLNSIFKITQAAILNQSYPTAPMTPSFWQANVHDFGFEKPTGENTVRERNHARFWFANLKTADGKNIYVGTASLDIGLKYVIVHKIKPDLDSERELLFNDLQKAEVVQSFNKEQFVEPLLGQNFAGDQFFTDGKIYVINLKD